MSGPGIEDKPDKDYWKTGDPNLRAKVISSVGVALIVLTIAGAASFENFAPPKYDMQLPEDDDRTEKPILSPQPTPSETPQPVQPAPPAPPDFTPSEPDTPSEPGMTSPSAPEPGILRIVVTLAILAIPLVGIILVIIGIILYLRKRKKATR